MSPVIQNLRLPFTLATCVLLAACATGGGPGAGPSGPGAAAGASTASTGQPADQIVMDRAEARWNALVERRFDEAWSYLTPGYRDLHPQADYALAMASRPVRWDTADVTEASCETDVCTVKVLMTYSLTMPQPGVGRVASISGVDERWILVNGDWYHLPESD